METSKGEEIANSVTHGIGSLFSIIALTIMIIFAAKYGNIWQLVSVIIYGTTLVILYTMSTLYHSLFFTKARKVFQVFDHASIYLLIAGTYTPFTLVILRQSGSIGWIIFGLVWGIAILGIIIGTLFIGRFRLLKTILYIVMGWIIVLALPQLIAVMSSAGKLAGIYWLVAGGIAYTVGTLFYLLKKVKYFHSVWHIFVLLGTVCHFIAVMFYVL